MTKKKGTVTQPQPGKLMVYCYRPPLIETPEQLEKKFQEFISLCYEEEAFVKKSPVGLKKMKKNGTQEAIYEYSIEKKMVMKTAPTLSMFCAFVGTTRSNLWKMGQKDGFGIVYTKMLQTLEAFQLQGWADGTLKDSSVNFNMRSIHGIREDEPTKSPSALGQVIEEVFGSNRMDALEDAKHKQQIIEAVQVVNSKIDNPPQNIIEVKEKKEPKFYHASKANGRQGGDQVEDQG